jgi:hypothetical protein
VMHIDKALKLLGLSSNPSLPNLLAAYRKRAKKYHPDLHPNQQEKAHRVMVLLNNAYKMVLKTYCIEEPFPEEEIGIERVQESEKTVLTEEFSRIFNKHLHVLFEGILTYYQYGLENVYLRTEGTRRIRYRRALQQMHKGLTGMLRTKNSAISKDDIELYKTFTAFSKTFFHMAQSNKKYDPTLKRNEAKPYKHYTKGSRLLDIELKNEFFRPYFNDTKETTNTTVINHELMTVITKYAVSEWAGEAVIKLFLLDQYKQVLRLYRKHNEYF